MTRHHEHGWRCTHHFGACHWYAAEYVCSCGKIRTTRTERDPVDRAGDLEWLDGECPRCRELLSGAVREHREWVYDAGRWNTAMLKAVFTA